MDPGSVKALLALRKHSRVLRHRRASADCFGANPVASALGNRARRDPGAAVRTYHEGLKPTLKTGTFYLAGNRNFLFGSDKTLLDDLGKSVQEVAGVEKPIEAILDFYLHRTRFESIQDFEPGRHLAAYEHAASILLSHAERGWISVEQVVLWLQRFEEAFTNKKLAEHTAVGSRVEIFERAWRLCSNESAEKWGAAIFLLNRLGSLNFERGRYREAESFLIQARQYWEQGMGDDLIALYQPQLGILYQTQGRYEEAETAYKRDLAIYERILKKPSALEVVFVLGCLAGLYADQGRHDEAESHYVQALAIVEKDSRADERVAVSLRGALSEVYALTGQYGKAESLRLQELRVLEKAFGDHHPVVGGCLNNLAEIYRLQGRYEEAEPLYRRALTIREESKGGQHPDVAQTLNNLAILYLQRKQYAEVEAPCRRALEIRIQALGDAHPATATSLSILAHLYAAQDRDAEAYHLYSQAASIYVNALGHKHPDVSLMLNGIAGLHAKHGEHEEANNLYQSALAIASESFGPDHPNVVAVLRDYAELLAKAPELKARLRKQYLEQAALQGSLRQGVPYVFADQQSPGETTTTRVPLNAKPKVGRNQSCPCGSGKKCKKCCGA